MFDGDDRDAVDDVAIPLVAISLLGVAADAVVGTVRIHQHPEDPGVWWGSRLAVTRQYRRLGALGAALIRLAVSSAHARGCQTLPRQLQSQNADLFQPHALAHARGSRTARPAASHDAGRPRLLSAVRRARRSASCRCRSWPHDGAAPLAISALAQRLRRSSGIAAKSDIAAVAASLGLSGDDVIPVGDDCAAIPDGDGYLLFAIEGFMNEFVAGDPWFAGWCGVMVNISDVAAMGGRPIAVVDAIWAEAKPMRRRCSPG